MPTEAEEGVRMQMCKRSKPAGSVCGQLARCALQRTACVLADRESLSEKWDLGRGVEMGGMLVVSFHVNENMINSCN